VTEGPADEVLIGEIAGGRTEAIGELYDRYATILFPVALRIVRSRADAEDVLHDVFTSLPERAATYSPARGSVGAWLVIVVRNLSIDRTRRYRRRAEIVNAAAEPSPSLADVEATAALGADFERARAALATLPPQLRETIETAFFEGLSYPEIAERDGVPLGTVKSRAARALHALAAALGAGPGSQP